MDLWGSLFQNVMFLHNLLCRMCALTGEEWHFVHPSYGVTYFLAIRTMNLVLVSAITSDGSFDLGHFQLR